MRGGHGWRYKSRYRRRKAKPAPELLCTNPSCHGSNLCDDCRAMLDRYGEPDRPPVEQPQQPTTAESRAVLAELWRRMGEGGKR